jgi:hypothetical protein
LIRFVAQWLIPIALAIFAVVDCLLTPRPFVRALPKSLWMLLILVPYVGALLWIFTGRATTPHDVNRAQRRRATDDEGFGLSAAEAAAAGRSEARTVRGEILEPRANPVPPDDDPEFLRRLGEQMRKDRPEG